MRTFFQVIWLAAFGGVACLGGELPGGWATDYTNALSVAAREQKPLLVFFTASWCGPCKLMAQEVLPRTNVQAALSNLDAVAVDIDDNPALASHFSIAAVPTFVILSADGNEARRATGLQSAEDFASWLTNGAGAARQEVIHHALMEKQLADLDPLLVSSSTNDLQTASSRLIELCAVPDDQIVLAASGRLKTLAEKEPALLLEGLNHSRLAARIQVANILRARLGDKFNIDPWADAATRAKAIQDWRSRLADK